MADEHPNLSLFKRLDIRNLAACSDLFAQDFVWHYINPRLPDIEGDFLGLAGLQKFFEAIGAKTNGTFKGQPISITACGDELVVTHVRNTMTIEDQPIAIDAVVVWRVVDGRLAEAWDIPSAHTMAKTS